MLRHYLRNRCRKFVSCGLRNRILILLIVVFGAGFQLLTLFKQKHVHERHLLEQEKKFYFPANKLSQVVLNNTSSCRKNVSSDIEFDISDLLGQVEEDALWAWISKRIKGSWPDWVYAAKQLSSQLNTSPPRKQKRILVVPGVLIATPFASEESIRQGGPLGDLYQWSDVIAALHLLGHNVTLTKDIYAAARGLKYNRFGYSPKKGCPETGFDLVFADIITMKSFPLVTIRDYRCLFRVLDAYGTEQMFNHVIYSMLHDYVSQFGRLNLHLKQFYTFYPHTPDNSFMGFALSKQEYKQVPKENIGVLYGKDPKYFQGKNEFIKQLMRHMEVHSTLNSSAALPAGVVGHGVLTRDGYLELLARAKYFIGVGLPMESTGVMEALAHGCIFINPKYRAQQQFCLLQEGKPTTRKMTSQVPYLENYVGAPNVLTIDIHNTQEVEEALQRASSQLPVKPLIPDEFTMQGFLERLNAYIENQDFCNETNIWPSAKLMKTFWGTKDESCVEVCTQRKLICENAFFPLLNYTTIFNNITCDTIVPDASVYYPARTQTTPRGSVAKCILQTDGSLYSCAGSHELLHRLCPCREYRHGQIVLPPT